MRILGTRVCLAVVVAIVAHVMVRPAAAIYLDKERNVALRARIYSQASIRIEDSNVDTTPRAQAGQLVQHRNFYNPELDARLTKYTRWMGDAGLDWLQPDDFSFRIAGWGFYDGIYDYGASQYERARKALNPNYPNPLAQGAFYLRGENFNCPARVGARPSDPQNFPGLCVLDAGGNGNPVVPYSNLEQLFPDHKVQNPRDIFASQERINELYFNYSRGPVFLRVGRQAISWGEADTIALLDQNNPFDISAGAPGAFVDLDEARIPLWTVRASYNLFDEIGPFASGVLEAYWVPGTIDNETGIVPPLTAAPYSPRGLDPQNIIRQLNGDIQFVLFDHLPEKKMSNSRYGVRLQSVVARDHTLSVWMYTHFPSQPVAHSLGSSRILRENGQPTRLFTTETVHELTTVYGIADSFFVEPIDSILRAEVEYFENEPGFIPELSLGASGDPSVDPGLDVVFFEGTVPKADIFRWEFGLDRFFFFRPLNPSNSFLISTAVVGHYNIDETDRKNFRFAGQRKPGGLGTQATDFVDVKPAEAFWNTHLETQWMHGKVFAAVTTILHSRGTWAAFPEVRYRMNDSLMFTAKLVTIGGKYQGIGFYNDRDQIALRATYQIN